MDCAAPPRKLSALRWSASSSNRITTGLILAALIVGAAMMMRVETAFRIWGYPGLAILLFLAAAGGGVVLLINILFYDKGEK